MRALVTGARDKVFPALVNISVITVNYYSGKETKGGAVGSGTIITPDGYILTNQHVTDMGKKFRVTLADQRELAATVVGEDVLTDLAVLKINPEQIKGEKLPFAQFGDSSKLVIGDYVMAMGSPLALSRSVTLGIVSNNEPRLHHRHERRLHRRNGARLRPHRRLHHLDPARRLDQPRQQRRPCSSPSRARSSASTSWASTRWASPSPPPSPRTSPTSSSSTARSSAPPSASPSSPSSSPSSKRASLSTASRRAALPTGPALKPGDLITGMDGKNVTVKFAEEVPPSSAPSPASPSAPRSASPTSRGDQSGTAVVTTEKLLKDRGEQAALRTWGLSVSQITTRMAKDRQLDNTDGAMVSGLHRGGPAEIAEPKMEGGDIIHSVDGQPVKDLKAAVEAYKSIMSKDPIPEFVLIGPAARARTRSPSSSPAPTSTRTRPAKSPRPGSASPPSPCSRTSPSRWAIPTPWASASPASTPARSPPAAS